MQIYFSANSLYEGFSTSQHRLMDTMSREAPLGCRHNRLAKFRRSGGDIACCVDPVIGGFLMSIDDDTSLCIDLDSEISDEIDTR